MKQIAQVVVFFLELVMLGTLAYCGYRLGNNRWFAWGAAIFFPVMFMFVWGLWAAPKSPRKLSPLRGSLFRLSLFLIAFGWLALNDHAFVAATFFALAAAAEWIGQINKSVQ